MPAQGRTRPQAAADGSDKLPFDIDAVFRLLRKAVKPFRMAAMFELADEGYSTLFEQLVACIISIRTRDETTVPTAKSLFEKARAPAAIAALSAGEIDQLIRSSTFHRPKAQIIREIARRTVEDFGGELPCDEGVLTSFKGVGPKCAHLALGVACGQPHISVDIHVHRVTNRWGYVQAATPEKTMVQLQEKLPRKYWIEINRLLVPFGKHVCTSPSPKCSNCPLQPYCRQVGVSSHR